MVDAGTDRFAYHWLALRESADHVARSDALAGRAAHWLGASGHSEHALVDLGAGRGSNMRYLAPRLPSRQRWTLVDHDARLLESAASEPIPRDPSGRPIILNTVCTDLAGTALNALPERGLVTAAALLDLVSDAWLKRLIEACAAHGAAILIALSVDGRTAFDDAPDGDDEFVLAQLRAHQRRDKGMGCALGPEAPARLAELLPKAGYAVFSAASDWRLDPTQPALAGALLGAWAEAAAEQRPHAATRIRAWRQRRVNDILADRCTITVGHRDVLGLPPA